MTGALVVLMLLTGWGAEAEAQLLARPANAIHNSGWKTWSLVDGLADKDTVTAEKGRPEYVRAVMLIL